MTTYRTGNHWGITIVREGDVLTQGRMEPTGPVLPPRRVGDQLVAVIVNGDQELAERICALLNGRNDLQAAQDARGGHVSPDDMQRFEIEAQEWRGSLGLTMRCERCGWVAVLESPLLTLAELVQRADEHTEDCR